MPRSVLIGGWWIVGQTASHFVVGSIVLVLRIALPGHVANWPEVRVALMINGFGANIDIARS